MAILGNITSNQVLASLKGRLPPGWEGRVLRQPARLVSKVRSYFLFEFKGPDGRIATVVVEVKAGLEPRDVPALKEQLTTYARTLGPKAIPLIFAPFLSSSTRLRLAEAGVPYLDNTGNVRIMATDPAMYIETQGAERNPSRVERPAKSLKGAKAGRIVRTLCDGLPPFAVRKVAKIVGINPGYVSRVFTFLAREDIIERKQRGPVTTVRWRQLIERWAEDYSFLDSNRVVSYLEPRDIGMLPARLANVVKRFSITGSSAAATVAPVAPTRLIAAYVQSPEDVAKKLNLRPAESGANVLLAEPYDPVVFDRTRQQEGVPYAALSQVAVDLLSGSGRGPSEAQALLNWMQANESDWRD